MVVLLQAQRCTRLDRNAFDLKALAAVNAVIPTPGARHLAMHAGFRTFLRLQPCHHLFDLLGMAARCHQQRIGRVDDRQVLRAERDDGAVWRVNICSLALDSQAQAVNAVALVVSWR